MPYGHCKDPKFRILQAFCSLPFFDYVLWIENLKSIEHDSNRVKLYRLLLKNPAISTVVLSMENHPITYPVLQGFFFFVLRSVRCSLNKMNLSIAAPVEIFWVRLKNGSWP